MANPSIKDELQSRGLLSKIILPPAIDVLLGDLYPTGAVTSVVKGSLPLSVAGRKLGFLAVDLTVPDDPLDYLLEVGPGNNSFRFWVDLTSEGKLRRIFEFAAGAAGAILKPAEHKRDGDEESLTEIGGPKVGIEGV